MTRPKIWKDTKFGGRPWLATNPYQPEIQRLCATWEEAMEYVQEKSRNPLPLELYHLTVTYEGGGKVFIHDELDDDIIVLGPRHWRPLARALTRLADKEGVK